MPIKRLGAKGGNTQKTRSGINKFNLDYIPAGSSYVVKKETGVNLVNCWGEDAFGANSWSKMLDTFKPNTTYTMKAKAKVVSRPSTITAPNLALFMLYRPSTNSLGDVWTDCLRMNDKETISLNTEKEYITTFKTPANMTDVRFITYCFHGNNTGETEVSKSTGMGEIDVSEIMLVEGDYTAENFPDFELYGVSPSPAYPSEIKSVGESWNKLDESKVKTTTAMNGISWRYKNNKINIYGTATSTYSQSINVDIDLEEGTYSFFTKNNSNNNLNYNIWLFNQSGAMIGNTKLNNPVTITEKATKFIVFVEGIVTGTTYDETVNIQLVEGTEEKPYRDFGYNLFIEKKGKNEFDINSEPIYKTSNTNYSKLNNGVRVIPVHGSNDIGFDAAIYKSKDLTNYVGSTVRIKCSFESSGNNAGAYIIGLCNKDGTSRQTLKTSLVSGQEISFVVPELTDKTFLAIWFYVRHNTTINANDYVDYTNIIVTIDDEDTNYEPYFHETYTIPLNAPLRSLPNGTKDVKKTDGTHRRIRSAIFDGSDDENWYLGRISPENWKTDVYVLNVSDQTKAGDSVSLLCSHFKNEIIWSLDKEGVFLQPSNGALIIRLNKDRLESSGTTLGFKQWLQQNPIEVIYELAEEVIEPYTEEQLAVINSITTEKGTTYFKDLDGAEMEIEYYKDLQLLFEKVVSE